MSPEELKEAKKRATAAQSEKPVYVWAWEYERKDGTWVLGSAAAKTRRLANELIFDDMAYGLNFTGKERVVRCQLVRVKKVKK